MTNKDIIQEFAKIEKQKDIYTDEYIEEIESLDNLNELIETVAMWHRTCEGSKIIAMRYILETLDAC